MAGPISTSLAPWLTVRDAARAVDFYKSAFDATETYRLEIPDGGGLIVRLSMQGAEFWVSSGAPEPLYAVTREVVGGGSVRMILTVADPQAVFAKAVAAGATEIHPVGNQHGWRLGRLVDPVGLHWEIGHQLDASAP
jgi:PhnB protein